MSLSFSLLTLRLLYFINPAGGKVEKLCTKMLMPKQMAQPPSQPYDDTIESTNLNNHVGHLSLPWIRPIGMHRWRAYWHIMLSW